MPLDRIVLRLNQCFGDTSELALALRLLNLLLMVLIIAALLTCYEVLRLRSPLSYVDASNIDRASTFTLSKSNALLQ